MFHDEIALCAQNVDTHSRFNTTCLTLMILFLEMPKQSIEISQILVKITQ